LFVNIHGLYFTQLYLFLRGCEVRFIIELAKGTNKSLMDVILFKDFVGDKSHTSEAS